MVFLLGFLRKTTTWLFSLTRPHLFHSWPEPQLAPATTSYESPVHTSLLQSYISDRYRSMKYHSTTCRWVMEYEMYSNLIFLKKAPKILHTPIPKMPIILGFSKNCGNTTIQGHPKHTTPCLLRTHVFCTRASRLAVGHHTEGHPSANRWNDLRIAARLENWWDDRLHIITIYYIRMLCICNCWRHGISPPGCSRAPCQGLCWIFRGATISKPLADPKATQAAGITNMFCQESASGCVKIFENRSYIYILSYFIIFCYIYNMNINWRSNTESVGPHHGLAWWSRTFFWFCLFTVGRSQRLVLRLVVLECRVLSNIQCCRVIPLDESWRLTVCRIRWFCQQIRMPHVTQRIQRIQSWNPHWHDSAWPGGVGNMFTVQTSPGLKPKKMSKSVWLIR